MQFALKPEYEKYIHEKLQGGKNPNIDVLMIRVFHFLEKHKHKEQELLELWEKINDGAEQIKHAKIVDRKVVFQQLQNKLDLHLFHINL